MRYVAISPETRELLRAHANPDVPFHDTAFMYDGQWHIELDEQVYARLEAMRLPSESFDTVIRQLFNRGTS